MLVMMSGCLVWDRARPRPMPAARRSEETRRCVRVEYYTHIVSFSLSLCVPMRFSVLLLGRYKDRKSVV